MSGCHDFFEKYYFFKNITLALGFCSFEELLKNHDNLTTEVKKEEIMVCPECGRKLPVVDSRDVLANVRHRRYKCKSCNLWVYTAEKVFGVKECFGAYAVGRSETDGNDRRGDRQGIQAGKE